MALHGYDNPHRNSKFGKTRPFLTIYIFNIFEHKFFLSPPGVFVYHAEVKKAVPLLQCMSEFLFLMDE